MKYAVGGCGCYCAIINWSCLLVSLKWHSIENVMYVKVIAFLKAHNL